MLPRVYDMLAASSAVQAVVQNRIWRHSDAPKAGANQSRGGVPYLTWFLVNGTPENTLSELPSADRMTVQVDCYAASDAQCEQVANSVRDAIEPYGHCTAQPIDLRDAATGLWRMALQFDIFVIRPLPEPTS